MRIVAVIFGMVLILLVALDAFETIVLPRRVTRRLRLTRLFYRAIQLGWKFLGHLVRAGARRDAFLGYMGPLSLLALLALPQISAISASLRSSRAFRSFSLCTSRRSDSSSPVLGCSSWSFFKASIARATTGCSKENRCQEPRRRQGVGSLSR